MAVNDSDMDRCRVTLLRLEATIIETALRGYTDAVRANRDSESSAVGQMDCEGVLRTITEIERKISAACEKAAGKPGPAK